MRIHYNNFTHGPRGHLNCDMYKKNRSERTMSRDTRYDGAWYDTIEILAFGPKETYKIGALKC